MLSLTRSWLMITKIILVVVKKITLSMFSRANRINWMRHTHAFHKLNSEHNLYNNVLFLYYIRCAIFFKALAGKLHLFTIRFSITYNHFHICYGIYSHFLLYQQIFVSVWLDPSMCVLCSYVCMFSSSLYQTYTW